MRRTRSSHPWALTTRHPWRVTVRRNTPPPPPDGACPPCIETRCLAPLVRCASERAPRVSTSREPTHSASSPGWGVHRLNIAAEHCRLDVDPRTKSHGRIHSGGGCSVRRTLTSQGWRVGSAHGRLERVRRTEHPSPVHHPQSAREVPNRCATCKARSIVIDSADTGHRWPVSTQSVVARAMGRAADLAECGQLVMRC